MLEAVPDAIVVKTIIQQYGVASCTAYGDLNAVRAEWVEQDNEHRAEAKSTAVRRILGHIRGAKADKAWGAVASLERLLAQIQGTMEPIQLEATVTVRNAVFDYLNALSEDEMDSIVAHMDEVERKAALFDQGINSGNVIEAVKS
jgi:hypothetical protein